MRKYAVWIASLAALLSLWFFLDGYLTKNHSSWSFVFDVWPLWIALVVASFVLGCFAFSVISPFIFMKEKNAYEQQCERDNVAYQQSVDHAVREENERLIRQESMLRERSIQLDQTHLDQVQQSTTKTKALKKEAKAEMKKALELQAEAQRQIIQAKADVAQHQKRALNASKALERTRQKHKAELAKLKQDNTE